MKASIVAHAVLLATTTAVLAAPPPQTTRRMLAQPEEIQGYACAKGYAFFYTDGHLQRCFVSRETAFGEIRVPQGSIINLLPDGRPQYVMLAHNTLVSGVNCSGDGLLGPAEGSVTTLYPSGKFKACYLVGNQRVQGVPCESGGFFHAIAGHDLPVEFYENGKFKSCLLSADYGDRHRGERFEQRPSSFLH